MADSAGAVRYVTHPTPSTLGTMFDVRSIRLEAKTQCNLTRVPGIRQAAPAKCTPEVLPGPENVG